MKGLISYRFTGEKPEDLKNLLIPVRNKLKEVGVDAYCNLLDEDLETRSKSFQPQDYVFDAFRILDSSDMLFAVVASEYKSEGMIMEVGYSIAKGIPVIVAIKEGIADTYLPGMANLVIHWNNLEDLLNKISKVEYKSLSRSSS